VAGLSSFILSAEALMEDEEVERASSPERRDREMN
jgi:hypothetical protein